MNKRSVRCFRGFASIPSLANIEVFYTVPDLGEQDRLFTCIDCGTIFVLDASDPRRASKAVEQIGAGVSCPTCTSDLEATLREYPAIFRGPDGRVGQFDPERFIPPDSESLVMEFFDISSAGACGTPS